MKTTFTIDEILTILEAKKLDKSYTHYNKALKDVADEVAKQSREK